MPVVLSSLQPLVEQLHADGYRVIGPTLRGDAIVPAELGSASDLPYGVGVRLGPASYRTRPRADVGAFAHVATPQSWKPYLNPPRTLLWSGHREPDGFTVTEPHEPPPRYALLGVRPCDLHAIGIQDRVLGIPGNGNGYAARRAQAFIIAVNCTEPGETCFCTSMATGPRADAGSGYDLVLTELAGPDGVHYLADAGSESGRMLLGRLPQAPADAGVIQRADDALAAAVDRMGRRMPATDLRELLAESLHSARWDDVAQRCMSCGNCTMVCPTCFCSTVSDETDLTGDVAERWLSWDSCFSLDFSYIHGGEIRPSTRARYRQWLTHKLSTWYDQFGQSGCVGCGRCIVWCPVGIDLTAEVAALEAERSGIPATTGSVGSTGEPTAGVSKEVTPGGTQPAVPPLDAAATVTTARAGAAGGEDV